MFCTSRAAFRDPLANIPAVEGWPPLYWTCTPRKRSSKATVEPLHGTSPYPSPRHQCKHKGVWIHNSPSRVRAQPTLCAPPVLQDVAERGHSPASGSEARVCPSRP